MPGNPSRPNPTGEPNPAARAGVPNSAARQGAVNPTVRSGQPQRLPVSQPGVQAAQPRRIPRPQLGAGQPARIPPRAVPGMPQQSARSQGVRSQGAGSQGVRSQGAAQSGVPYAARQGQAGTPLRSAAQPQPGRPQRAQMPPPRQQPSQSQILRAQPGAGQTGRVPSGAAQPSAQTAQPAGILRPQPGVVPPSAGQPETGQSARIPPGAEPGMSQQGARPQGAGLQGVRPQGAAQPGVPRAGRQGQAGVAPRAGTVPPGAVQPQPGRPRPHPIPPEAQLTAPQAGMPPRNQPASQTPGMKPPVRQAAVPGAVPGTPSSGLRPRQMPPRREMPHPESPVQPQETPPAAVLPAAMAVSAPKPAGGQARAAAMPLPTDEKAPSAATSPTTVETASATTGEKSQPTGEGAARPTGETTPAATGEKPQPKPSEPQTANENAKVSDNEKPARDTKEPPETGADVNEDALLTQDSPGEENRKPKRTSTSILLMSGIGQTMLSVGVVLALFVVWQLFVTSWQVQGATAAAVDSFSQANPQEASDVTEVQRTDPPPEVPIPSVGQTFATLHVPRWDSMVIPVMEGTSQAVLDTGYAGHYINTQGPGQMGNFVLAAHRRSYGNSFRRVEELVKDDPLIVETPQAWLVYQVTSTEVVLPSQGDVTYPVPHGDPNAVPTEQLMTLTTCHPEYSNTHRFIVYSKLSYWVPRGQGRPLALQGLDAMKNSHQKVVKTAQPSPAQSTQEGEK